MRLQSVHRRIVLSSVIVAAACMDSGEPAAVPEAAIAPAAAVATGPCWLSKDIAQDARSYFSQPEQKTAQDLVQAMNAACKDGSQVDVAASAWQIVALVETVLEADRGGDPATGSALVNGLLGCTSSLCETLPSPAIDFTGALMSEGLFALRSQTADPAISRNPVQFTDLRGTTIDGIWGVEVDQPWAQVAFADPVLIYGNPLTSNGAPVNEATIGNIQYKLDVYPDAGEFLDGALHVGACFSPDVVYDDGTNLLEPLLQRELVLLEAHVPGFCGTVFPATQTASLFGPLVSVVKSLLPAPFAFARADKKAPAVGGTPLDFSRFALVAANTNGYLEFLTQPDPSPTEGEPIGNLQIRAMSGADTPMEKVVISVYLIGNYGIPAGAELSGDLTAITQERDGLQGIATLDNVLVGKPGGYTLCATGSLAGFTFAEACSDLFNVKNAN